MEHEGRGPTARPIRVLIVDDQQVFRRGLRRLLAEREIEVVGEAARCEEALTQARLLAPDVVVLDPDLPGTGGIELIGTLARGAPLSRIVVLTATADGNQVAQAISAGACGYVLKDAPVEAILDCIRAAAAGDFLVPAGIAAKLLTWFRESQARPPMGDDEAKLTARELEVLRLIAQGMDNSEIARTLYLSPGTVKNHTSRIFEKLRTQNRVQAAVYAALKGIL